MVRAGVVEHPSQWPFCGYNEIQKPKRKNIFIDYERLRKLLGFDSYDRVVTYNKRWVDDYLEKPFQVHRAKAVIRRLLEGKLLDDDSKGIIEKVKAYTERNFQKNVSLNDVASFVALSPKYLSRLFKAATGTGFNDYKIELKINKGKELLRTTALNINQITDELGYLNTESFIRIFKKVTGETPTEFRAHRS